MRDVLEFLMHISAGIAGGTALIFGIAWGANDYGMMAMLGALFVLCCFACFKLDRAMREFDATTIPTVRHRTRPVFTMRKRTRPAPVSVRAK